MEFELERSLARDSCRRGRSVISVFSRGMVVWRRRDLERVAKIIVGWLTGRRQSGGHDVGSVRAARDESVPGVGGIREGTGDDLRFGAGIPNDK